MITTVFGFAGAFIGILAAFLWFRASRLKWNVGREGRQLGDYARHQGEYATPNDLEVYLNDVGKLNSCAAFVTGLSMLCWAGQTLAGYFGCH